MDDFLKTAGGVLGTVAPLLARALGGPLAGTAVGLVCNALGLASETPPDQVSQAVANATPEQLLALKSADNAFKAHMADLQLEPDRLDAADRASSRSMRTEALKAGNGTADQLAWVNILSFLIIAMLVLIGCYFALRGDLKITPENQGIWMAVAGLIGAIVGYFASNAQQVNGFFFGSSTGSRQNADTIGSTMHSAITGLVQQQGGATPRPLAR